MTTDPFRVSHVHDKIPGAVYVGRPNKLRPEGSKLHNPYVIGEQYDWIADRKRATRADVLAKYRAYLMDRPFLLRQLPALRGMVLECWCRHYGQREPACHADVIHEILDTHTDDQLRGIR